MEVDGAADGAEDGVEAMEVEEEESDEMEMLQALETSNPEDAMARYAQIGWCGGAVWQSSDVCEREVIRVREEPRARMLASSFLAVNVFCASTRRGVSLCTNPPSCPETQTS